LRDSCETQGSPRDRIPKHPAVTRDEIEARLRDCCPTSSPPDDLRALVFTEYHDEMVRRALRIVMIEADAQDVVAHCFAEGKFWKYDGRGAFAGFAGRAVKNAALDLLRRRHRDTQKCLAKQSLPLGGPLPPDRIAIQAERAGFMAQVWDEFREANPLDARAIELQSNDQLASDDIADILAREFGLRLKAGAVTTRICRARAKLRNSLQQKMRSTGESVEE
jgi:DNA-directed RNA polymerase specialized sigma24 family protein